MQSQSIRTSREIHLNNKIFGYQKRCFFTYLCSLYLTSRTSVTVFVQAHDFSGILFPGCIFYLMNFPSNRFACDFLLCLLVHDFVTVVVASASTLFFYALFHRKHFLSVQLLKSMSAYLSNFVPTVFVRLSPKSYG